MSIDSSSLAASYARDGFVFPLQVLTEAETADLLRELESAESDLAADTERFGLLHAYPDRLLPGFDALIRHPVLITAVSQLLGPDLLVWSAAFFHKSPRSDKIVTWHQDLTYWDLDDAEEVTAWFALTPATIANGCMRFLPGSHARALPHVDTFAGNNLLTRGQHVAVEVNDADGVDVELSPGQASLHHGHLIHSSGPNTTDQRRTAAAIRFIKPSMRQRTGARPMVAHISGEDRFEHFDVAGPPAGRLSDEDFERCRTDAALRRRILYAGAEDKPVNRYG